MGNGEGGMGNGEWGVFNLISSLNSVCRTSYSESSSLLIPDAEELMPATGRVAAGANRCVLRALFPAAPDVGQNNRFKTDQGDRAIFKPLVGGDDRSVK